MSGWVVAALVLNAALVVVAIVFAVRIGTRSVVVAVELELQLPPVATVDIDATPRLPLFTPAQMTRTEWHALLGAFDVARTVYLRELTKWRNEQPRTPGSLERAQHELEVARRRLTRFEREISVGVERHALGRR